MQQRQILVGNRRVAAACALLLVACASRETALHAERPHSDGDDVLAVVGTVEITEAEVAEAVAAELLAVERERQAALEKGLDRLVSERLIALEAASRGVSPEELLSAELEAKVTAPTDAEVDAFYEERKGQIRQPKEEVAERIRGFLAQQRRETARQEFLAALKAKHGYRSHLEPFRVPVETAGYPAKGPADAAVTIVEFSDFECPFCGRVVPTLEKVTESYGPQVRLVFRQFPLNSIHPRAQKAAEASLCAHEQQKFWEMHDAMFAEQKLGVEELKETAARLGLDAAEFESCLDSSRHAERVAEDLAAGSRLGVTGTPALFINGRFLSGAQPYEVISELIDDELARSSKASS